MSYLFTSESVSEGHPDKIADQISDALLDEFLRQDPNAKVACETLVTTGLAILCGEIKTNCYIDIQKVARGVIKRIGYTKAEYMFDADSCGIISSIHEQSADITQGVERQNEEDQGAGDQGMMFGYACRETDHLMPLPIELAHLLLKELAIIRHEGKKMTYLRPDSKSQVTIEYDDNNQPLRIHTVVISTQHDEFEKPKRNTTEAKVAAEEKMILRIKTDVESILIPRVLKKLPKRIQHLFEKNFRLLINPTGKFVIGGPHGDTGLTGRKIIVDTYGGRGSHGGGAFSGKDSSKMDRSAAYAVRHIAKNVVASGIADEVLIQVSYAIGVTEPIALYINTNKSAKVKDPQGNIISDAEITKRIQKLFDLRPSAITKRFGLKNPIFEVAASYGHVGRECYEADVTVYENGKEVTKRVEFFGWEKLDSVEMIKREFGVE